MKTLEQFNNEKNIYYHIYKYEYPRLNEIACPNCGNELFDSDDMILTSYPPKKNIHCSNCNYHGYRLL